MMPPPRLASSSSNGSNTKPPKKKNYPSLGKLTAHPHVVRLRHPGDRSGSSCANTATRLWKSDVCKEPHNGNLDSYKASLETKLEHERIVHPPVFCRPAVNDTVTGEPLFAREWFLQPDAPAYCHDTNGIPYYEVVDAQVLDDLNQPRQSGTKRKESNASSDNGTADTSTTDQEQELAAAAASVPLHHPHHEDDYEPAITSLLAKRSVETLNIQKNLRLSINAAKNGEECVQLYDDPFFQETLDTIRFAAEQYLKQHIGSDCADLLEEWAMLWAKAVSKRKGWAKTLEECRKTIGLLLFRVCDLWNLLENESQQENPQVIEHFQKRRVHQIMWHLLVMDRANALFNMALDRNAAELVRGLGWYSKYDDGPNGARDMAGLAKNPHKPAINKRYQWLYHKFYSQTDVAITKWLRIAFPPRLVTPEHMHDEAFLQELQHTRENAFHQELERVTVVRQDADGRFMGELDLAAGGIFGGGGPPPGVPPYGGKNFFN